MHTLCKHAASRKEAVDIKKVIYKTAPAERNNMAANTASEHSDSLERCP